MSDPITKSIPPCPEACEPAFWKQHHREAVDMLLLWANTNSGSRDLAGLQRQRDLLVEAFSQLEPDEVDLTAVEALGEAEGPRIAHGDVICLSKRSKAARQVLLVGHYDTVYGPEHPFQQCRWLDSGLLNGPGVADMKGGLVIILHTLTWLEREISNGGLSPDAIGWEVRIVPDEEIGTTASREILLSGLDSFDFGLLVEPSHPDGRLVRNRLGGGAVQVMAKGRAAHSGRNFEEGRSAILNLSRFLLAADRLNQKEPRLIINPGRIEGGGALNAVPALATAGINLRAEERTAAESLLEHLHLLAEEHTGDGHEILLQGGFNRWPRKVNAHEECLFQHLGAIGKELGQPLEWADTGGGSDANLITAKGLPMLDGMGVLGGQLHSAEEYAEVSSLLPKAWFWSRFLLSIAREGLPEGFPSRHDRSSQRHKSTS